MRTSGSIIFVFIASLIVESQQTCSLFDNSCGEDGCCIDGKCKNPCFECIADLSCTDGCCIDFKCHPKWSYRCIEKNRCTKNSECESNCCKNNQCQTLFADCIELTSSECSSSTDCYTSSKGSCCVEGSCGSCPQNYDGSPNDSSGGSSSSSGGNIIVRGVIIAVAVIIALILKIVIWALWCSRRRRERVVIVRRRTACVAVSIAENDELQREHERAWQEIPDYPPPAYSPTAELGTDNTPYTGQTQGNGVLNVSHDGAQQGPLMVPPPPYTPRHEANPDESTDSAQTDQTQAEGVTSNAREINDVQQGSLMEPPPTYPPSPKTNTSEHTTGENL